jgi:hypothetical protein
MPAKAIDDKSVGRAVAFLKTHTVAQRKLMRADSERAEAGKEPLAPVEDLRTVEMWAQDAEGNAHAWAAKRDAEATETINDAQQWKQQVDADNREAEQIARGRANTSVDDMKKEVFEKFDEYRDLLKEQADNGEPWAKKKLAEWNAESKEAKKSIDRDLGPTLDKIDQRRAARMRKTRLIADASARRAEKAKAWRAANTGKPENWSANQRADVQRALAALGEWADEAAALIKPYGSKAKPNVDSLAQVKQWTEALGGKLNAPTATTATRQEALVGIEQARAAHAEYEQFLERQERDATTNREVVDGWVQRNNALAKIWANANDPKQREWAAAWNESRGQPAAG